MPRLGLCCTFFTEPIAFRSSTAAYLLRQCANSAREKLAEIIAHNAVALSQAIDFCADNGIGCFRISSGILPLRTHPKVGYLPQLLPGGRGLVQAYRRCGEQAAEREVRLTMHPDQFVVLSSPDPAIIANSCEELEHQAEVASWTGADVLILHGGGGYGDKAAALDRFAESFATLSSDVRTRLAVENDERVYPPSELLPLCERIGIPLVYDVHHHRCLPDALSVSEATQLALPTWNGREPLFHISSPLEGWNGPKPQRHHDYIDPADFPVEWDSLPITVEVEAKAKELAVKQLRRQLAGHGANLRPGIPVNGRC